MKDYLEAGAVRYRPQREEGVSEGHIHKKAARNKALEVVFDPKDHKDYVTGFRKRKQARRKEALKKLEKRARAQRLEERAERRASIREQLHLDANPPAGSSDEEGEGGGAAAAAVRVFTAGGLTSTVTVCPIETRTDSEPEEEPDRDPEPGTAPRQAGHDTAPACGFHSSERQQLKPMSKGALRTLTKTKLKVAGRKGRSVGESRSNRSSRGSAGGRGGGGGGKGKGRGRGKKGRR